MRRRVTIADVAKAAGVSKQTVSRAINDKGEISPETKESIMAIVNRLGYRPNRLAQAMNTQRSHMIGLVVPDITNPFFPEVARGVQDAAFERDYNVFFCNSDERSDREIYLLDSLVAQGVDGIIVFSNKATDDDLLAFADRFRPIVLVNRVLNHPNIEQLIVENGAGGRLAVEHFVRRGHREIGHITNQDFPPIEVQRTVQFQHALQSHGLNSDRVISAEATMQGGYHATQQLLSDFPNITALFTYNDLMGIGAIRACRDLQINVPNDISIIGFDDIQLARMYSPSLSTIRVDKHELGKRALHRLTHLIAHPNKPLPADNIQLDLVLRESTR